MIHRGSSLKRSSWKGFTFNPGHPETSEHCPVEPQQIRKDDGNTGFGLPSLKAAAQHRAKRGMPPSRKGGRQFI